VNTFYFDRKKDKSEISAFAMKSSAQAKIFIERIFSLRGTICLIIFRKK